MVNYFLRVNCFPEYLHRYAVWHAFRFFVFVNKDPYNVSEGCLIFYFRLFDIRLSLSCGGFKCGYLTVFYMIF